MPTQKYFDQLLVYVDLYQDAKNQAISLICSGEGAGKAFLVKIKNKMLLKTLRI